MGGWGASETEMNRVPLWEGGCQTMPATFCSYQHVTGHPSHPCQHPATPAGWLHHIQLPSPGLDAVKVRNASVNHRFPGSSCSDSCLNLLGSY